MAADNLETWFINGQEYVTPKAAARYMGIEHKTLLGEIVKGRLPVVQVEKRQLVELETLQAYAASDQPLPRKQSRGEPVEEWI